MHSKITKALTWFMVSLSGLAWLIALSAMNRKPCGDGMCGAVEIMVAISISLLALPFLVWHAGSWRKVRFWSNVTLSIISPFVVIGAFWGYLELPRITCLEYGTFQPLPPSKQFHPSDEVRIVDLGVVAIRCTPYKWELISSK
jgi:hypothetical protein